MRQTLNKKTDRMPDGRAGRKAMQQYRGRHQGNRMNCGTLRGSLRPDSGSRIRLAHICPVRRWAQALDRHLSFGFALDIDGQSLTTGLAIGHIAQMTDRGLAGNGERFTFIGAQSIKVFSEIHTPMIFTVRCCRQHPSVNSPLIPRMA